MLYIAENLKGLRKEKGLTQEEAAEMLGVCAQSVSKWERGDTLPDITLLPSLANLYQVSVDALIGMDKIGDDQARAAVFDEGHRHLREGNYSAAADVFSQALKTFPNDAGLLSELAFALALDVDPAKWPRAISLCERVLSGNPGEKIRHTTRAALCFISLKAGETHRAAAAAQSLPHVRESREAVLAELEKKPSADEINACLRFIVLGESDEQDIFLIDFGVDMVPIVTECDLRGRIGALRDEMGSRLLPPVRIRDEVTLPPRRVRVRRYADYLLDRDFNTPGEALEDVMDIIQQVVTNKR